MKNKLGQTFRQGRQADDSDQDTGDAVDGDDLPQAEAFPEKADPAAEQEPPGRRSQKDTSQDEPCRLRMTAVAQVEAEEGEQTEHQHQGAGIGDGHQETFQQVAGPPGTERAGNRTPKVLDRILQSDLQADAEHDCTTDQHHPDAVPVEELADVRDREQRDGGIERIGYRRAEAHGETRPTSLAERPLDAHNPQRAKGDGRGQTDEECLEEKQNHNLLSGDKYTIIPSKNLSLSVFTD